MPIFLLDRGIIFSLQIFLYFCYIKSGDSLFLTGYFIIGTFILIYFLLKGVKYKIFLYVLSCILVLFFFSIFSQNYVIINTSYNLFSGIIAFITACFIYEDKNSYKYIRVLFLAFSFYILYNIFILGFSNPDLYNDILFRGSRNIVSAICIFLLLFFILSLNRCNKKIYLFYPMLTFLLSVILYGRTGIILSFFILAYMFVIQKEYFYLKLFLFFSLFILFISFFNEIHDYVLLKTSFSYGMKTEREVMMREYFSNISFYDFFFGRDLSCCSLIRSFDDNPHNSFISGHIRFGISHTLFSIFIFLYVLLYGKNIHRFFILILYARLALDQIGLFSPLDIVIFYILIDVYRINRKLK